MNIDSAGKPNSALKISQEVLASIARYAALEVEGVESVSTGNIGVKGLITKTSYIKAIKIEMAEEVVNVEISIIVKHGVKIPELAHAVQSNVKNAMQSMTGLAVAKVDVVIAGVSMQPGPDDQAQ